MGEPRTPLRFKPAFRRRKLPTEEDLAAIPAARMGQFQLTDAEVKVARRMIYQRNKDWYRTGVRYGTRREFPYLYVMRFD
jgi:hypothetical protein